MNSQSYTCRTSGLDFPQIPVPNKLWGLRNPQCVRGLRRTLSGCNKSPTKIQARKSPSKSRIFLKISHSHVIFSIYFHVLISFFTFSCHIFEAQPNGINCHITKMWHLSHTWGVDLHPPVPNFDWPFGAQKFGWDGTEVWWFHREVFFFLSSKSPSSNFSSRVSSELNLLVSRESPLAELQFEPIFGP